MRKKYDFDYIIIGSGPAGSAAATILTKAKKRVALVESRFLGGSNINTRDIPYQVSLDFAHLYSDILMSPEFSNQDISYSLPNLQSHQLQSVIKLGNKHKEALEAAGVVFLHGTANILDKNTIAMSEQKFTAANLILATGARLKANEISGMGSTSYLTPENALKLRRLPRLAIVIGGGSTGCEIAEFYAKIGIKTIIIEMAERLLPKEDVEIGQTMNDYFKNELGIVTLTNCKVVALEQDQAIKKIIFRDGNSEKSIRTDCVVIATGSEPILDYGLENAGVKYKNTGIIVDKYFQTSSKNVYAVGDAIGGNSSTSLAEYQGTFLANNLVEKSKNPINYNGFIRTTNTNPQVATVGFNEDDLLRRDRKYKKVCIKANTTPIGQLKDDDYSFIKLIADKNERLLGATIIAPHAELIAEEIAIAIRHHLTTLEVASTPHPTNSYNYMIKLAAKKLLEKRKLS